MDSNTLISFDLILYDQATDSPTTSYTVHRENKTFHQTKFWNTQTKLSLAPQKWYKVLSYKLRSLKCHWPLLCCCGWSTAVLTVFYHETLTFKVNTQLFLRLSGRHDIVVSDPRRRSHAQRKRCLPCQESQQQSAQAKFPVAVSCRPHASCINPGLQEGCCVRRAVPNPLKAEGRSWSDSGSEVRQQLRLVFDFKEYCNSFRSQNAWTKPLLEYD